MQQIMQTVTLGKTVSEIVESHLVGLEKNIVIFIIELKPTQLSCPVALFSVMFMGSSMNHATKLVKA